MSGKGGKRTLPARLSLCFNPSMTTVAQALDDLLRDYESESEGYPVFRWHENSDKESKFYSEIAAELAVGYSEGRYSYDFGDFVANALWGVYWDSVGKPDLEISYPDLLARVYYAFDAGELANPSLPSHDPIKTHTDPMIADILADL